MDTGSIALIVGGLTFLGLMSALVAVFGARVRVAERLGKSQTGGLGGGVDLQGWLRRAAGTIRPLGEFVPRSAEEMSRQERKLVQAGIRSKDSVVMFYAVQVGLFLGLLIAFLIAGSLYRNPILYGLLSLLGGAALPDIWLALRTAGRRKAIQHALPDAMDLSVIAMEAGLGLDQTLLRVGQEFETVHPVLSEELRLQNLEVNLGRSRTQAFRNLAGRTGVDDLKALVAILIQTDRFGTSIAEALRVFSDTLRTKRRQRAEEQAAKLPVKMIIPLMLFIFPGVIAVILGPAVIAIINDLLPGLAGGN